MLTYLQHIPENVQDGAPVIMLLHGRGSDPSDMMGLQPSLPQNAIVIAPQAPFSGATWGYGGGWAWYQFLGNNTPEASSFEESQRQLGELIRDLPQQLPVRIGTIALGGFSQGATTSMGYALRNPGQVPLIINFSGFIPNNPSVQVTPETVRGMRFFWGHGLYDQMISFASAREGRALLQNAGAQLQARDYRIGHWIAPEELQDMVEWWEASLHAGI